MFQEIADRLQFVRSMYNLSQRELAKRAGVTNSSVSMIEQGRVSPSIHSLEKILSGVPMTVRDFFNIDYQNQTPCFYRSFELFTGSDKGVDSYCLDKQGLDQEGLENPPKGTTVSALIYQVYKSGADSGEYMLTARGKCRGIVIQGDLEVTVNSVCQSLEPGDGFLVQPMSPYRIRNLKKEKAIVVISHHANEQFGF